MRNVLPCLVLVAAILMSGCAQTVTSGTGTKTASVSLPSTAQLKAGVLVLKASLTSVEMGIAVAKAKTPDKAADIDAKIVPLVSKLKDAVNVFSSCIDTVDSSVAQSKFDAAWTLVNATLQALAPYAVAALI